MKKWTVVVPTFVFVSTTVEAETEDEAYEKVEDLEFGLEHSPSLGGVISAVDRDMDMEAGEPDYENMKVYEAVE